jgi:dolichol kinase
MVHWCIAVIPLVISENGCSRWSWGWFSLSRYNGQHRSSDLPHSETLVTLFALHQALLPPLKYLTTTSLLPAELHLLSVALINVLLFADSPQMNILSILLWWGGLGIFLFCGHVINWGVELARIPRWRFRRAGQVIRARQTFLQALSENLSQVHVRPLSKSDTDEGDDFFHPKNECLKDHSRLNSFNRKTEKPFTNADCTQNSDMDPSARQPVDPLSIQRLPFVRKHNYAPMNIGGRLSAENKSNKRPKRSRQTVTRQYLSLTPLQTATRKWIYALYVYTFVVVLILGPIRSLISSEALANYEPFGWAIGYLFGEIPIIRLITFSWGLENWIALPDLPQYFNQTSSTFSFPELRKIYGAATFRLFLIIWCIAIITIGLAMVLTLTIVEVDTRRKVFHGMMVAMFLPTTYIDPCFISLAFVLVLTIFLLLDLLRASQLPPLSKPLARFLAPYVDGRDLRGPVVVSHIFLLVGCGVPVWLALAGMERMHMTGYNAINGYSSHPWTGWDINPRSLDVSIVSGIICVGLGDAAASLIGRRYGRHKWPWVGGKSLEGSAAFMFAVMIGLLFAKGWLYLGGWCIINNTKRNVQESNGWRLVGEMETLNDKGIETTAWEYEILSRIWELGWVGTVVKAGIAGAAASLMEAVLTGGNDNVVVPIVLWILVKGLDV